MTTTTHNTFNLRPVVRDGALRATHRTAYATYCYIRREPAADQFGAMPREWGTRGDLIAAGRVHPAQTPAWARSGPLIWNNADASIKKHREQEAAAFHAVLALPPEQDASEWEDRIETFCVAQLADNGMIADWAIHYQPDVIFPHVHLLITARSWRNDRMPGRRHPRWFKSDEACRAAKRAWSSVSGLRTGRGFYSHAITP